MKKLSLVAALLAVTLAGCGKNSTTTSTAPKADENKVYAAADGHALHIAGSNSISVDGAWTTNAWEPNANNLMSAAAIKDVRAVSATLADTLASKADSLVYLYIGKVQLGVSESGWNASAMKNGEKVDVDGSNAIKAIEAHYDETDDTYINDAWLPDPKVGHVETLTPETLFMPTWTEEKDENGFSWSDNPVCIGEAGTYTFVVAKYKAVSAAGVPGYGMGLVAEA